MSGGFETRGDVLPALASSLRGASQSIEHIAGGIPATPDAGVAAATISRMLSELVGAAGTLSVDALEAADRLTASQNAYVAADEWAVADLPTLE